uniref:Uncharacterized protein n=1 Tax=Arundo donax TaxID=35708 RepID=A0A0A9AIT9_ARUDO
MFFFTLISDNKMMPSHRH